MPGAPSRWRLFVALELPAGAREALERWRVTVVPVESGLRAVETQDLHVTLCFLGATAPAAAPAILEACAAAAHGPAADLALGMARWLPRRSPRVLAVELADGQGRLGAVQRELSGRLAAGGWYRPERRPFLAHVTVARVRRGARVDPRLAAAPESLAFRGERVTLYRSALTREGARYERLGTVVLGDL